MKKILTTLGQRWPEYLLEILVITMGILGAFALNNWNEMRLQKAEEEQILRNIRVEFQQNRVLLQKKLQASSHAFDAAIEVLTLVGATEADLAERNLDSLIFTMIPGTGDFIPTNYAINNIIQSGKLNLITNDSLISLLHDWEAAVMRATKYEEGADRWITEEMVPHMLGFISFKQVDSYGGLAWAGKSRLQTNYYDLFQSLRFENNLDNMLFLTNNNLQALREVDEIIQKILAITDSMVPKKD